MMGRKDYRSIAGAFANALSLHVDYYAQEGDGIALAARNVAEALKADNPNFRYDKFFEAIGLDSWGEVKQNVEA